MVVKYLSIEFDFDKMKELAQKYFDDSRTTNKNIE